MPDDRPIVNWLIDLQGRHWDLSAWASEFSEGSEYRVETEQTSDGVTRYYLHSSKFIGIKDVDIYELADTIIATLNGIIKVLRGGEPVIRGLPITIRDDGSRVPLAYVSSDQSARMESLTTVTTRGKETAQQRSPAMRWAGLSEQNPNVALALGYFSKSDNWIDFYKTFETIRDFSGKDDDLANKGWLSKKVLNNLKFSMNLHRHAKEKDSRRQARKKPRDLPLSLPEARECLRKMMECWLRELTASAV